MNSNKLLEMNIIFPLFLAIVVKKSNSVVTTEKDELATPKWMLEPATAPVVHRKIWARRTDEPDEPLKISRIKNSDSSSREWSSSVGEGDIKEQWRNVNYLKKREELKNFTLPSGDIVNMVAARPWGVSCGDPTLHDMPWGSCMLPMECEPELRIWKGDYFCGNTAFVCCGIVNNVYDLYKGFDASLASLEDSAMRDEVGIEEKRKKISQEKKRRQTDRLKRKNRMKSSIKKIIREVRSILNKLYRNETRYKKKKTKQMKQFVKALKDQYKKDRQAMKDVHEIQMITIDQRLRHRLEELKDLNENFMKNATFRQIIINGTVSIHGARMLLEAYPELESYFTKPLEPKRRNNDYLNYDIEYGLLYN